MSKKKIPHIEAVSAVIQKDGKVLLKQRPTKGFLGGLWEFPNWPVDGKKDLMEYLRLKAKSDFGLKVKCKTLSGLSNSLIPISNYPLMSLGVRPLTEEWKEEESGSVLKTLINMLCQEFFAKLPMQ